jgi:hypothetical protein
MYIIFADSIPTPGNSPGGKGSGISAHGLLLKQKTQIAGQNIILQAQEYGVLQIIVIMLLVAI